MRLRCFSKGVPEYKWYGERGIGICKRWDDFSLFALDMGDKPSNLHTLERINNNGNYTPENCKWATQKEQANNTRNIERAQRFELDGKEYTIRQLAELTGIKRSTMHMRLVAYKWPVNRAVSIWS